MIPAMRSKQYDKAYNIGKSLPANYKDPSAKSMSSRMRKAYLRVVKNTPDEPYYVYYDVSNDGKPELFIMGYILQ